MSCVVGAPCLRSPKLPKWVFLASGAYVLFCAPFVCSNREGGLTEMCRITYLPATIVCFFASCRFLLVTRLKCPGWQCATALVAVVLSGSVLLLLAWLLAHFSTSSMN